MCNGAIGGLSEEGRHPDNEGVTWSIHAQSSIKGYIGDSPFHEL